MKLIDSISFPGSKFGGGMKTGTGDDRYAFDEAAGWACVIDGATDVGPVRIFSAAESDAARYAEIFAAEIMKGPADAREVPQAWFGRLLPRIRAAVEREVKIPLKDAPLASYPTAAATWVRHRLDKRGKGVLEGATLGDSIAIVKTPSGAVTVFGEASKAAELGHWHPGNAAGERFSKGGARRQQKPTHWVGYSWSRSSASSSAAKSAGGGTEKLSGCPVTGWRT